MGNAASGLPVTLGGPIPALASYPWQVYGGVEKKTGRARTVFKKEKKGDAVQLEAATNAFTRMRTLHHPSLLRCLESLELDKELLLVTEEVLPLAAWLETLAERPPEQAADQLLWGLETLLQGLIFLNEVNGLVHGAVCLDAVFVTPSGDWRLGALDLVGPAAADGAAVPLFMRRQRFLATQTPPPELAGLEGRSPPRSVSLAPASVDMYGLGKIFEAIMDTLPTAGARLEAACGAQLRPFTHDGPAQRPTPAAALRGLAAKALKRPMVTILRNLQALNTKEMPKRVKFLETVGKHLDRLPQETRLAKVLPCCVEILEAATAENALRQMGSADTMRNAIHALLPLALRVFAEKSTERTPEEAQQDFTQTLLPVVSRLVALQDRSLRLCLLAQAGTFAAYLDDDAVNRVFFEPILLGFADSGSAALREATLKSLVHFLGKLNDRNLNDRLPQQLLRLQRDPEAGIRTNIAIFIGRMAPKLKPGVRSRMLLQMLARGLKDPFFHARVATMRALLACQTMMDEESLATKVLPLLCPLFVDPVASVRTFAFECLEVVRTRLSVHSDKLREGEEAKAKVTEAAAGAGGGKKGGDWATRALTGIAKAESPRHRGGSAAGGPPQPPDPSSGGDSWERLDMSLDADLDIPDISLNGIGGAPATGEPAEGGWGGDDDDDWAELDEDEAPAAEAAKPRSTAAPKVVLRPRPVADKADEKRQRQEALRKKREEKRRQRETSKALRGGNRLGLPMAASNSSLASSETSSVATLGDGVSPPPAAAWADDDILGATEAPAASAQRPAARASSQAAPRAAARASKATTAAARPSRAAARTKVKPVKLKVEDDADDWDDF